MAQKYPSYIRKTWLGLNIIFVFFYTLYLLTWMIILPGVDKIPRFFYNFILSISHSLTLDFRTITIQSLSSSTNLILAIFFMTNPRMLFILPFYMLSIANTSSAILYYSKLKKYSFYKYCAMIEQKKMNLIFSAYVIEILILPVMICATFIGLNTVATLLSYFYMLKISFITDEVLKDAFLFLCSKLEENIHSWPKEYQQYYAKFKAYTEPRRSINVSNDMKNK